MDRVLLVDTNFSARPLYNYLVKLNFDVYVIGSNPNDSLAKSEKNYINADYSNLQILTQIVEDNKIDYLVPGCNDLSYSVCSKLNKINDFNGIDSCKSTETIHCKNKFRDFCRKYSLPSPRIHNPSEIGSIFPFIVKPVDSYSGRGVSVIGESNKHDISKAVKLAQSESRTGSFLVEDFVSGQLYSHSAFIKDKKIVKDFFVQEYGSVNPFVVDTSHVTNDLSNNLISNVQENIELISEKLALSDGLVHTQFIVNQDEYWLIEVTRRCPGDLYGSLIDLTCGSNYYESYVNPFIGKDYDFNKVYPMKSVIRHTVTVSSECCYTSISFKQNIKLLKYVPLALTGDTLHKSPASRVGVLFFENSTKENQKSLLNCTVNRKLYSVD